MEDDGLRWVSRGSGLIYTDTTNAAGFRFQEGAERVLLRGGCFFFEHVNETDCVFIVFQDGRCQGLLRVSSLTETKQSFSGD